MWENSNCYNYKQGSFGKNCCGEQEKQQSYCCKRTEEDSCYYYPNYWQVESEQSEGDFKQNCCCKKPKFNENLNENYFENYGQKNFYTREEKTNNSQCSCSKNNWGYIEQKQCFKPKKRCCFCDFFNCICGRR